MDKRTYVARQAVVSRKTSGCMAMDNRLQDYAPKPPLFFIHVELK
jgi:hypothetical protein